MELFEQKQINFYNVQHIPSPNFGATTQCIALSPALLGPRVKIDIFPNGLLYGENSIKLVHFWE